MPGHPLKPPLSYIITQSILDLCRGDIYIKAIGKCFSSLCPSASVLFSLLCVCSSFFPVLSLWSLLGVVTQDLVLVLKTKPNANSILTTMIWTCFPVRDDRFLWDLVHVIVSWTKESFPYLGRLWDALWLFWMIHSPWIHNRKMIFFCSFNNFTKHLCSEIPGVYFAQDWETTAGKANSLPLSEYVTQIKCMTV